jgi:lipopolysaccharide transport system permease protein
MYLNHFKALYNRQELIFVWTKRTILARYQQSILGVFWAIIQPAAVVLIFSVIFTKFIPVDTGDIPYVVFSYTAMLPWTLFSSSITDMVDSLVINMNLVSKIYFPREILPLASVLARLFDFAIASSLLIILMIYYRMPLLTPNILYLPFILFVQLALMLGIGFIGAALNVFFRDLKHIFALVLQLWFYATPIIYPVSVVPEQYRTLYSLNPMVAIIQSYRAVLLYQQPPDSGLSYAAMFAFVTIIAGYWFFKKLEFQFADVV